MAKWLQDVNSVSGMIADGEYSYCNYNGRYFTLHEVGNILYIAVYLPGVSSYRAGTVIRQLNRERRALHIARPTRTKAGVSMMVRPDRRNSPRDIVSGLMTRVDLLFTELQVPKDACCICNSAGSDDVILSHGVYSPAHSACAEKAYSAQESAADANERNSKHYGPGTVGAILGALIGALPLIISITGFSYISAYITMLLSILIGLGAWLGYRVFTGQPGPGTRPIIIIASVIGVAFACLAVSYIFVVAYSTTVSGLMSAMNDYFSNLPLLLISVPVFGIIGIVYAVSRVPRNVFDTFRYRRPASSPYTAAANAVLAPDGMTGMQQSQLSGWDNTPPPPAGGSSTPNDTEWH